MHIKVKNQSHFLNLMEDSILATAYFHNKDIDEFKNINLDYNSQITNLSLNKVKEDIPKIQNTLGLIIFTIFIFR